MMIIIVVIAILVISIIIFLLAITMSIISILFCICTYIGEALSGFRLRTILAVRTIAAVAC